MKTTLKNSKLILLPLIAVFSLLIIQNSNAAQVTFIVKGHLDYVGEELAGTFSIGDLYHLEYSFDSTTIDSVPGDPIIGAYVDAI